VTDAVILLETTDLGYLTIEAAVALARDQLKPGATNFVSKKLGNIQIRGDNLILGKPFIFDKSNIANTILTRYSAVAKRARRERI